MLFSTLLLLAISTSVRAHGTITAVTGANGVQGTGFGIIASTPRTGSSPKPFEQDTSIIRDNEISSGKTGTCGRTPAGGNNDVATQLASASQAGLASAGADGSLTMTLHQVNQDGAGPFSCDVSTDGGNTFAAATVSQNVPGFLSLSLAKATDFPLTANVPAGTTCTGGPNGDACIMRCRNKALAGPFGSCVPFTMGGAASTSSNTTAAASTASTDTTNAAANVAAATTSGPTTGKKGKLASLFGGLFGRGETLQVKKRYINSRVAGARSGYWI